MGRQFKNRRNLFGGLTIFTLGICGIIALYKTVSDANGCSDCNQRSNRVRRQESEDGSIKSGSSSTDVDYWVKLNVTNLEKAEKKKADEWDQYQEDFYNHFFKYAIADEYKGDDLATDRADYVNSDNRKKAT